MDPKFARTLCGYRAGTALPSTSDKGDVNSIRWGRAMFDALGVAHATPEISDVGTALEVAVVEDLRARRPDLIVDRSRIATDFDQYRHLSQLKNYMSSFHDDLDRIEMAIAETKQLDTSKSVTALRRQLNTIRNHAASNRGFFCALKENLAEESMLRTDIAVTSPRSGQRLLVALSSKWSLRTDRAQDCVSQGSKLVSLRRGHMPHFAVITMEPRPSMLRLLTDGSGSVDCVYHVAFGALKTAANSLSKQSIPRMPEQLDLLDRMIKQNRIRPFSALLDEINLLP
ncbi:type II site-specific deoxyribonuclease [Rhodococcus triatomae]|uniref:NgoMIV restriction enzyme n=1 Tax=Rhodococcus triatomae TaxID=300028 RepID=A0A1G8M612_9NOCA|nr:NgoMIV family type II restriction endonuclease [Rhodococcus triatomae]QNG18185.1 type II site-specific deoxyribonuclease [Rhodococcus triatomae]QNG22145.1 type II site-specific deoxyribonuclease [Rhodococcus triatomae]SDI63378.1 NgoMIV restriction enzyme [Rhodococcus triatomae]